MEQTCLLRASIISKLKASVEAVAIAVKVIVDSFHLEKVLIAWIIANVNLLLMIALRVECKDAISILVASLVKEIILIT